MFPVLSSSPHSTYSRCGSNQALAVASHWVRRRPAGIVILEPHDNHKWRSVIAGSGLYHRDKALPWRAFCKTCSYCRPSKWPIWWRILAPSWEIQPQHWTDTTTAFAGRHILRVVSLTPRSSFVELNVDSSENVSLSHLRSTVLSANDKRYSLRTSVKSSSTSAFRALSPASLSLDITGLFFPGKLVAALRSLALTEGFLWASAKPLNHNVSKQRKNNYGKITEIAASLAFLAPPMEHR